MTNGTFADWKIEQMCIAIMPKKGFKAQGVYFGLLSYVDKDMDVFINGKKGFEQFYLLSPKFWKD